MVPTTLVWEGTTMEIKIIKTCTKSSPVVGDVTVWVRRITCELLGGSYKDIHMEYTKNNRKVSRTFEMDTCGRLKFRSACTKLELSESFMDSICSYNYC